MVSYLGNISYKYSINIFIKELRVFGGVPSERLVSISYSFLDIVYLVSYLINILLQGFSPRWSPILGISYKYPIARVISKMVSYLGNIL